MIDGKVIIPIQFDAEGLVYCKEAADMRGVSLPELIQQFIDDGMRRIALEADFDEVVDDALWRVAEATRRAEIELDVPTIIRRRHRRNRRSK